MGKRNRLIKSLEQRTFLKVNYKYYSRQSYIGSLVVKAVELITETVTEISVYRTERLTSYKNYSLNMDRCLTETRMDICYEYSCGACYLQKHKNSQGLNLIRAHEKFIFVNRQIM
jgi:hypothetical protein